MRLQAVTRVMFKIVLPFVVAMVVLGVVIAWLSGIFIEKIPPGETARVRRVVTAEERDRIDQVHEVVKDYFSEAVGTLRAASRTEISARIMAPIVEVRVKAGDQVEQGVPLIVLDARDMQSRLAQAQAALHGAQASLAQARSDHERNARMYAEKAIPKTRFEQSQTALDVAKAEVKQAEEAVAEARVTLSYTTITAIRAGTIVDRLAEPGDIARPGVPLLVLYDPASLRLEVPVMEDLALKLKVGTILPVHIDSIDQEVDGVVDEIVPQAEAASRSFLVKVAVPRLEQVYENMFGRLRIPAGSRPHLCLSMAAIQSVGQNDFVDVVESDGTVRRRFIQAGRIGEPGRIEVLSGLEAGDRVLLPGPLPPPSAGRGI